MMNDASEVDENLIRLISTCRELSLTGDHTSLWLPQVLTIDSLERLSIESCKTDINISSRDIVKFLFNSKTYRNPRKLVIHVVFSRRSSQALVSAVEKDQFQLHFRLKVYTMKNKKVPRQVAKRRRVNSSSAGQNPTFPRKKAQILDDTWFEILKYFTCPELPQMSLVSPQVDGVIQRNLSRLPPPQALESVEISSFLSRIDRVESSMARSLQLLFHPIVYFKTLRDIICNREDRYIRCHSLNMKTSDGLPDVQGTIPTVVIDCYPFEEEYRAHLGENLIGREGDSQGADALYEIENVDKRVRISLFEIHTYTYSYWHERYRAILKFISK
ncbi:hypothetical protein DdX_21030 [Ditylenchus destructor]|uniref:Uncharacterized protein n=1 Tax=Ditylenchus destructor TaxID=166010 RepID=A0AAD4MFE9_9BILA|nr:hypothetical protein DdX_21030 [Ditylenchus destructor]